MDAMDSAVLASGSKSTAAKFPEEDDNSGVL
jgi:hypothetical protein